MASVNSQGMLPPDSRVALTTGVVWPEAAWSTIERRARLTPRSPALLHKQHGRWGVHLWHDVGQAVTHRRDALVGQGVGPGARLAVSGALEPQLLLLALAAQGAGATVITIDRHAQGEVLQDLLREANLTHAFVQQRKTLAAWIASGYRNLVRVPLYSAQSVADDSDSWSIAPLAALIGGSTTSVAAGSPVRMGEHPTLWVDEGTEWAQGLEHVLKEWLTSGAALAAPEVSASSTRDRQEILPQRLLVSAARQQRLEAERQARLGPPDSWSRRLVDFAASRGGNPLAARLVLRIDRLHGLPARAWPEERLAVTAGELSS